MLVIDLAAEDADRRNFGTASSAEFAIALVEVIGEPSEIVELPLPIGDLILTAGTVRAAAGLLFTRCLLAIVNRRFFLLRPSGPRKLSIQPAQIAEGINRQ
jgi:hypothetical protein